jgi:hypothetical protein
VEEKGGDKEKRKKKSKVGRPHSKIKMSSPTEDLPRIQTPIAAYRKDRFFPLLLFPPLLSFIPFFFPQRHKQNTTVDSTSKR